MKKFIIAIFLFCNIGAFTQNLTKEDLDKEIKPLIEKVKTLQSENSKLKSDIRTLNSKLVSTDAKLNTLQIQTELNKTAINSKSDELGLKISSTETITNKKISKVGQSISKTSLLSIIGVLLAVLLSGLLYWLMSKRQNSDKSEFNEQLNNTKSSIEESLIKEFSKQTELMETQLRLIEQQKTVTQTKQNVEPDHSLALKVASEINLIERNINLMDSKTKGLKQLIASVGKLKDNLAANGYEMPELLGKEFHQGMKVIVTGSISDENIDKDSEIISKILIPQVNYNDKMIQTAQIETSKGY